MKSKYIAALFAAVVSLGSANAVVVGLTGLANSSVGLITAGGSSTLVSGSAYFYSSSADLSKAQLASVTTRAAFEALLTSDPGVVRSAVSFTNGVLQSTGNIEMGAATNKTYLFLANADSSLYGIYQGPAVPALGAVTINPGTIVEDLVGTTDVITYGSTKSGFQLVPEPSVALLGALGVFGLVRRRR